jgi:hypothetical protein
VLLLDEIVHSKYVMYLCSKSQIRYLCCVRTVHYNSTHCTTLHFTTQHSTPLYYTTLYYTILHWTALHTTLHYNTLHYTTMHWTALHTTLHYTTLHYNALHSTHYISLHNTTLHYIALNSTAHYTILNYYPTLTSRPTFLLASVSLYCIYVYRNEKTSNRILWTGIDVALFSLSYRYKRTNECPWKYCNELQAINASWHLQCILRFLICMFHLWKY